jgi:hypothetical protein
VPVQSAYKKSCFIEILQLYLLSMYSFNVISVGTEKDNWLSRSTEPREISRDSSYVILSNK